ncbi:Cytochrome P450 4V3 [Colletotrichum higginsianum IMI 349063]|uniref:Cytochrome P450 4V3 n=1 Tax=Colletotrichum higginsianum (strain IMI 349063) TaxID=759273 RepID=A0A1B7YWQ4_COLHI|nr:Cytochrome P450 4V3 [Colletotrichum higginsianum IMI 349063]OBR16465.1 Cytochrome P450 4V3 [Colletotrichum higginsianum IMI 349063]
MHSELLPSIEQCMQQTRMQKSPHKTIVQLALKSLLGASDKEEAPPVDQRFVDTVVSPLKLFMLAGTRHNDDGIFSWPRLGCQSC